MKVIEWAWCPTCGFRTDNDWVNEKWICSNCHKENPNIRTNKENGNASNITWTEDSENFDED